MKTFAILALVLSAAPAFAQTNISTCGELLTNATENVKLIKNRFNAGEVTTTDVAKAELNQLELRFECRDISFKEYCEAAPTVANTLVEGVKAEARAGQADTLEVLAAERQAIETKGLCK